ncbi:MAG: 50S ribosomal protein L34e [archaeon]
MPAPRLRTKTFRKVKVKTPGGKTVLHHRYRKPSKAICAMCKKILPGVSNERPTKMQNIAKSKKRPERPYGGVYCSACTRKVIIAKSE